MTAGDRADDPGAAFEQGALVSRRFGDVYATRAGALAQSRAVFLEGCGLPGAWAGRQHFAVAELGFGTGLNMLAVLEAWAHARPAGGRLHLFSVEGFPLERWQAAEALAAAPELAPLAGQLLAQWPAGARGLHRIDFPGLGATLDLMLGDVADALAGWEGQADAWFLDGFSPAKNPAMWTEEVLAMVGARTAPGGRAATWSVAGDVRRGLAAAGFVVERLPGFGFKRERIAATMAGVAAEGSCGPVAVVGAGISGAALALALREAGCEARLFAEGPMASANPAALITPRLPAGSVESAALHALAFRRAVERVERTCPEAVLARGVERLLKGAEQARARQMMESRLFPEGSLALDGARLWLRDALAVRPLLLRAAWAGGAAETLRVDGVAREGDGWWLLGRGRREGPFGAVVLAAGIGAAALAGLRLRPVRGQVALAPVPLDGPPQSWGGYLVPTDEGLLFGATHGRGDADWAVREGDTAANLGALAEVQPALAARLAGVELGAVAGVRAAAPDHQPLAGPLGDGLWVLGGMGGRGFALAPLLAEHVAAGIAGTPSPLSAGMARLVSPLRLGRALRAADRPESPSAA